MSEHTKEPWAIDRFGGVLDVTKNRILITGFALNTGKSSAEAEANASRIVACVNACAGYSNEALEEPGGFMKTLGDATDRIKELEQQRDELAKAMQIIATTPGSAAHHRIAHQALVRGDAPPFGAASPGMTG